ncbi:MAG: hypothetical protein IPQ00_00120 [Chloracidobacterium sp.]|nr:hypothetical protein [Chloracidobacterium sp.]
METPLFIFVETAASKDIITNRTHIWAVTLCAISGNLLPSAGLGAFAQA